MINFPINFEVSSETTEGTGSPWTASAHNASLPITCCIPVEFSGPGKAYSPEDLFALSAINCIIAIFKFLCEKQKENFKKMQAKGNLILDLDQNKHLRFTSLDISFEIQGASNAEKIKNNLEEAIATCPVSNSIKTPKTFHINII